MALTKPKTTTTKEADLEYAAYRTYQELATRFFDGDSDKELQRALKSILRAMWDKGYMEAMKNRKEK